MGTYPRRGHFRQSKNGKITWVSSHLVNREKRTDRTPHAIIPSSDWEISQSNHKWFQGLTFGRGTVSSTRNQSERKSLLAPNANCPVCGAQVYFYANSFGSRVYFDDVGIPWPKHPCTIATQSPHSSIEYPSQLLVTPNSVPNLKQLKTFRVIRTRRSVLSTEIDLSDASLSNTELTLRIAATLSLPKNFLVHWDNEKISWIDSKTLEIKCFDGELTQNQASAINITTEKSLSNPKNSIDAIYKQSETSICTSFLLRHPVRFSRRALAKQDKSDESPLRNAICRRCKNPVFYFCIRNGKCVMFDNLGDSWPVHPCYRLEEVLLRKSETISPSINNITYSAHENWIKGQRSIFKVLSVHSDSDSDQRLVTLSECTQNQGCLDLVLPKDVNVFVGQITFLTNKHFSSLDMITLVPFTKELEIRPHRS